MPSFNMSEPSLHPEKDHHYARVVPYTQIFAMNIYQEEDSFCPPLPQNSKIFIINFYLGIKLFQETNTKK